MTGMTLLDDVLKILGFKRSDDLLKVGITFINQVCADLAQPMGITYVPVKSLSEQLCIPRNIADNIAVYGVAMYLALYRGDGEKNQYYTSLYNQKRRLLTNTSARTDKLPRGED